MPRTITETFQVFTIAELSESAKQKAYEEFLENCLFEDWAEFIIADAKTIGALIGINIDKVYFSGFSSQGDGACFEGSYEYKKGWKKALKEYAPNCKEVLEIAQGLQALQSTNFYKLSAQVVQSGHYNHSGCTSIEVTEKETGYSIGDDIEEEMKSLLRDFMDWIYKSLETEYEYQTSEKAFLDDAEANEREYYENGTMYF
jgi:hypothetical protein